MSNKSEYSKNVASWISDQDNKCIISNDNNLPIYNLFVILSSNNDTSDPIDKENYGYGNNNNCHYEEIFKPGKSSFKFENYRAMGNEHLVPTIYFTDTNNVQWKRNKNGKLEILKYDYIEKFMKKGIILKHVR